MGDNNQQVDRVMLDAQHVDETSAVFSPKSNAAVQSGYHHHISWAAGVAAGVVEIEYSDSEDYTGTWAHVATITFSGSAPNQDYAYTPGQPKAIRHRISTAVSGGASPSVTTRLVGAH